MWPARRIGAIAIAIAVAAPFLAQQNHILNAADRIQFTDLSRSYHPWPVVAIKWLASPFDEWLWPLTVEHVLDTATSRTGLTDFGDTAAFVPSLTSLLQSMRDEAHLSPFGRLAVTEHVVNMLSTRLKLQALLAAHGPAILAEKIEAPIAIAGFGRSGTTHLHNLLASTGELRFLRFFESLDFLEPPEGPDPRPAKAGVESFFLHYMLPLFKSLHNMDVYSAQEEVALEAFTFSSLMFPCVYQVPSYTAMLNHEARLADGLPFVKLALQVLQWQDRQHGRPLRRWLLKTPANIERLPALFAVWPDAKVVMTHRNPLDSLPSLLTLLTYSATLGSDTVNVHAHGEMWLNRTFDMARRVVAARRGGLLADRVLDIKSEVFFADNMAVVDQVATFAGLMLSPEARARAVAYISAHPRQGASAVQYDLGLFNLTREGVEARFKDIVDEYRDVFLD